ncbi:MAG: hypothetical protein AAFN07_02935 [Pseudomonadota bacterium]
MSDNRTPDHLSFLARQLEQLTADRPMADAIQKMKLELPEAYLPDLERLESIVVHNNPPAKSLGGSALMAYTPLAALLPEDERTRLFPKVAQFAADQRTLFSTYWAGLVSQLWYFGWLIATGLTLAGIMSAFVISAFEDLFAGFGSQLPALTRAVYRMDGLWFGALLIGAAVLTIIAIANIIQFSQRIGTLAPARDWHRWIPGFAPSVAAYNMSLFLNFTRILRDCGVDERDAITTGAQMSRIDVQPLLGQSEVTGDHDVLPNVTELAIAQSLGTFDAELESQCDLYPATLATALTRTRDTFSWSLRLIAYIIVGILVVASYLPIFQMGSVV